MLQPSNATTMDLSRYSHLAPKPWESERKGAILLSTQVVSVSELVPLNKHRISGVEKLMPLPLASPFPFSCLLSCKTLPCPLVFDLTFAFPLPTDLTLQDIALPPWHLTLV